MKTKRGFTVIELIIVIIVISISASGIAGLFIIGLDKGNVSGDLVKASQLTFSRIEYLKNLPYSTVLPLNNTVQNYNTIEFYPEYKLTTFAQR